MPRASRPLQPIRKDLVIRFRRQRLAREAIMAAKEISVKKYVVRLSGEERERLETLIRKGKSPARRVLKARILLRPMSRKLAKGGATTGSSKLWKPAHPWFTGCANNEVFPAVEARRLVERFEWHYTPKHGSWLNLAESEPRVLKEHGPLEQTVPLAGRPVPA